MIIPESCIPWIKKQRTQYKKDVVKEFIADIENDFMQIKPFLPAEALDILDIGCGVGGIDVLLNEHYKGDCRFVLLDSDVETPLFYGYKKEAACYNSFEATADLMSSNGVLLFNLIGKNEALFNWTDKNIGVPEKEYDIVISLLSMGYHYPIDTYEFKTKCFIADIREGTDGLEKLLNTYPVVNVIAEQNKAQRVVCYA
jgi:hypothetical protein